MRFSRMPRQEEPAPASAFVSSRSANWTKIPTFHFSIVTFEGTSDDAIIGAIIWRNRIETESKRKRCDRLFAQVYPCRLENKRLDR